MLDINTTTAKKLVLKSGYEKVYTSEVCSNGGNSGKISCKKDFIGSEVVVFILKTKGDGKDGK